MKSIFIIEATTNGEKIRYQTLFSTFDEAQNAINNLVESFELLNKMLKEYNIPLTPTTTYRIIQTR